MQTKTDKMEEIGRSQRIKKHIFLFSLIALSSHRLYACSHTIFTIYSQYWESHYEREGLEDQLRKYSVEELKYKNDWFFKFLQQICGPDRHQHTHECPGPREITFQEALLIIRDDKIS